MRSASSFIAVLLLIALVAMGSMPAQACPVCFEAKGGTLTAFRISTLFLSLIPFAAFAALFFWYKRRLKKMGE